MRLSASLTLFGALAISTSLANSHALPKNSHISARKVSYDLPMQRSQDDATVQNHTDFVKRAGTSEGQATFYDVTKSLGACGGKSTPDEKVVALNVAQYGNEDSVSSYCGKKVRISYAGITQVATIVDCCPTCGYGSLDMSKGLFSDFAALGKGVFPITWSVVGEGDDGDDSSSQSSSSSSSSDNIIPSVALPTSTPVISIPAPDPSTSTVLLTSIVSAPTPTASPASPITVEVNSLLSLTGAAPASSAAAPAASSSDSPQNLLQMGQVLQGMMQIANAGQGS